MSQESMRKRLDELRKENYEIAERRAARAREEIGDVKSMIMNRAAGRNGMKGTPHDVSFLQKMAIPGKRRKR